MELKLELSGLCGFQVDLLIVPYGIETSLKLGLEELWPDF